jgi:FkbM family methyltransferase
MNRAIENLIKNTLKRFGIGIINYGHLQQLIERSKAYDDLDLLFSLPGEQTSKLLQLLQHSKSQLRQDLFVLSELDFKRNGFFVEFGATNGVNLSNTYLLEKEFGWNGILVEPAECWHTSLKANRKCHIDTNCVWRESGSSLIFNETDIAEFSTIDSFIVTDRRHKTLKKNKMYEVKTISLVDLLDKYSAPSQIDYISIDTEGSEYEILSHFNFDMYDAQIITCEHNYTLERERIFSMLSKQGYVRKHEKLSKFDDWYVKCIGDKKTA